MASFLAMGGYAAYVWPAYGISIVVLTAATWLSLRARQELRRRVATLESEIPEPKTSEFPTATSRE